MRLPKFFTAYRPAARSVFEVPRRPLMPEGNQRADLLRAAWPKAPDARTTLLTESGRRENLPPGLAPARMGRAAAGRFVGKQPAQRLDLSFASGPARAGRIARGLRQAGIVATLDQPLLRLPTYSLLQGQLGRTDALKGKHMLSQKEWAAVWVALNVQHHGLKNVPTRITRLPMEMRYDFFVVAGVTDRPEESRHLVHTLRDAGVLSRRLHLKSFAAMPQAASALGLSADSDLLARIQDSLFVLPKYTFGRI